MGKQIKSPFKFLDAYDQSDRDIFFGREQETQELYDRLFETNVVLLYGASGTGKTSLINCGLGNEFRASDWFPIFIRRRDNIMQSIKQELDRHAVRKLPEESNSIHLLHSLYLDYYKPIYLIFDQFEEIFILGSRQEQEDFFELLYEIEERDLNVKIIISMREEYIAQLSEFENIYPSLWDNRLRIERMSLKNLQEVILNTLKAFDIQVENEEEVVQKMIEKVKGKDKQVDLATLQVYLDRLYRLDVERRGEEDRPIRFDLELLGKSGNLENVMAFFLEEQLSELEKELQNEMGVSEEGIPMDILFSMVTDNGTKQAVELDNVKKELKRAKNIDPKVVDFCISRFKEMRILRELNE